MWKIRASAEGGEIRLGTAATLAALDGPGGDVDGKLSEPNDTCSKFALAVLPPLFESLMTTALALDPT